MNYGYIRELNAMLLDKYNENEKELTFMDCYIFQLTSFGLSLFREHLLENGRISLSQAFMIRCIIEDIAVIRMYDTKVIPEDCTELLMGYQFLCEYKIYKKHKNLDKSIFDLNEIEKNYNEVKDFYYQKFGSELSSKEFRAIVNSKLPFLMEDYSFLDLIEMYCPEFLDDYKKLSIILHPSEIVTNYCHLNIDLYEQKLKPIFEAIVQVVSKYYPNITPNPKHEWYYEKAFCFEFDGKYSDFVNIHFPQLDCIGEICVHIRKDLKIADDKFGFSDVFFGRVYDELEGVLFDRAFGFSEIIKCKIKPLFELFAVFYYTLTLDDNKEILKIMEYYTLINKKKVLNEDTEEDIMKLYPKYKEIYGDKISYEEFKKIIMNKSMPILLGFDSINSFVFKMIDELVFDGLLQKDIFKLLYEESQLLSHGNGYMLSSNYGAFMDSDAACNAIDVLLLKLLEKYNNVIQNSNVSKKLKYDINKFYNEYIEIIRIKKANLIEIKQKMVNIK